jgi:hypothetical protein
VHAGSLMKRWTPRRLLVYAAAVLYLVSVSRSLPVLVGAGGVILVLAGTAGRAGGLGTTLRRVNDGLEYLTRRRAALAFAAASALAAAAVLVTAAPPQDAAPAAVALAIDGIPRRASPGIEVVASIKAKEPAPWGCDEDVEVDVEFTATDAFSAKHREVLERRGSRIAAAVHGDSVSSVRPAGILGILGGNVEWTPLDRTAPSVLRGITRAPVHPGTGRWTTRVLIRADWLRTRAVGSCWVRLPALTGSSAVQAQEEGLAAMRREPLRPQNRIAVPGPRSGLASAGAVGITGALVNGTDSRPGPRVGDAVWTCSNQGRPAEDTCLGWAVIDASWRQAFRDAMLLLCGVLLALTVELWLRAGDRTESSEATSGPKRQ